VHPVQITVRLTFSVAGLKQVKNIKYSELSVRSKCNYSLDTPQHLTKQNAAILVGTNVG